MPLKSRITPFLWFDQEAEEAAKFYCSIFPDSRITQVTRYGEAGYEHHHQEAGKVMTVAFELDGCPMTAINGGPIFRFNESVSFVVSCADQAEIDRYWEKLSAGGDPRAQQCGWLKDRYGLSWQVVPENIGELMGSGDTEAAQRVMNAVLVMKKLDLAAMQAAHDGVPV
jgi:predicted 3-demethylubiquinone-9 3-methyltransferase (glyoxalase superfamily)